MPSSPGLLLPRWARSARYAELRKEQLQPRVQAPNGPRRAKNKSFGTLLKHWYGRNLSDLTLATYIAASARRSPGGPDYCLTIEDGYTRRPQLKDYHETGEGIPRPESNKSNVSEAKECQAHAKNSR